MNRKGRPECLLSRVEKFWQDHHSWLESQYPGITLNRIKQELESCSVGHKISPEHFWDINYGLWDQKKTDSFFNGLKMGRLFQYILGYSYFYQSEFLVNENVLIPRSESERLVEWAIEYIEKQKQDYVSIADVGTGSGCLLLSIARGVNRPLDLTGIDISKEALKVAELNCHRLQYTIHPESKFKFEQRDRLKNNQKQFDLIVSNPPYIKKGHDIQEVHHQVKLHEPEIALFLKDDDYDQWFSKFFDQITQFLKVGGLFLMEGHEHHLQHLADMARSKGWLEVEVVKDYTERDRYLKWEKKSDG